MSSVTRDSYKFGSFFLDLAERQLLHDDQVVPLTPKVFDLLVRLVENSGHLVRKEELLAEIWPDSFVEETSLSRNISVLRKILSQGSTNGEQYIETIPKSGYRFIAPVTRLETGGLTTIEEPRVESAPAPAVLPAP